MEGLQVYTHTADPDFLGFQPGSVFQGSTGKNLLPLGEYYYRYELVECVKSMLSAALEGEAVSFVITKHKGFMTTNAELNKRLLSLAQMMQMTSGCIKLWRCQLY